MNIRKVQQTELSLTQDERDVLYKASRIINAISLVMEDEDGYLTFKNLDDTVYNVPIIRTDDLERLCDFFWNLQDSDPVVESVHENYHDCEVSQWD